MSAQKYKEAMPGPAASEVCPICGVPSEDGMECEFCIEESFVMQKALRAAKTLDDIAKAWSIWRNRPARLSRDEFSPFLDNCENCQKPMWVWPWERRANPNAAKYCSRSCADRAKLKGGEHAQAQAD